MGIFERLTRTPAEPELSPDMRARLDELERNLKLQEKGLKMLELEWQEWYDKFRLMFARLSKRIATWQETSSESDEKPPQSIQDAPSPTNRPHVGYGHPRLPVRPGKPNYGG